MNLRWESRPDGDKCKDGWANSSDGHFLGANISDTSNDCVRWRSDRHVESETTAKGSWVHQHHRMNFNGKSHLSQHWQNNVSNGDV